MRLRVLAAYSRKGPSPLDQSVTYTLSGSDPGCCDQAHTGERQTAVSDRQGPLLGVAAKGCQCLRTVEGGGRLVVIPRARNSRKGTADRGMKRSIDKGSGMRDEAGSTAASRLTRLSGPHTHITTPVAGKVKQRSRPIWDGRQRNETSIVDQG